MELQEYPDREFLAIKLAGAIASQLITQLAHNDHVLLAVPGGTSPGPVFDDLCGAELDWERVKIVLTDERWVAEDSPRSNTALLRERLLVERAAKAQLIPLHKADMEMADALPELSEAIAPCLPVGVALLGMGTDMHTASLFPDSPELSTALAADAPPLVAVTSPSQPEPRITLSAPVLAGAISTHLLIVGQEKRDALERAMSLPPEQAPIARFKEGLVVHWAP